MPGKVSKSRKKGKFKVTWGGKTRAKATTKKKAKKQLNLLRAIKHGWKPTRRKRS